MRIRWLTIFFDFPDSDFGRGVAFWRAVTGSGLSEFRGQGEQFATLLPPDGDPYLRVQRVLDGPGGCHLDLHVDVTEISLDETASQAAELGGVIRYREAGEVMIVDSPGGFSFCFVPWDGENTVPGPSAAEDGARSRVTELCLDIPPGDFDRELAFWSELTGWTANQSEHPELTCLNSPASLPFRLLLQRRDSAAPGDRVVAHPDFSCEDQPSVVSQHVRAGARIAREHPRWTVMTDTVNRAYCLVRVAP